MKRILIFSLSYHPFVGGAEIAMKEITDRLDQHDYHFDMITLRFDRRLPRVEQLGNITVHRIGLTANRPRVTERALPFTLRVAKTLFPINAFFKAVSLNGKHRYDMIWAMMANYAGFAALFFKWLHPHTPYFLELQDGNSINQIKARQPILRLLWPLYRAVYLRADVIKTISHFIARTAREIGYRGILHVIPNGVDVERFSSPIPEAALAALKARFDKRMGDIFLFTASRLVLSRGVEDVIRALQHLPLEVKLLIAGDGEDREKLTRIAQDSGVESRVAFAGHVDHNDLPAYYKISDIFVRASLVEGMGNAFIEAFATGIPVVATHVGGIPDFLKDRETGLFCEVRDPQSIARAVKEYIDDPALVARVVKNAKALAAQRYDWSLIAGNVQKKVFDPLTGRG